MKKALIPILAVIAAAAIVLCFVLPNNASKPLNEKITQLEESVKGMFSQEQVDKAVADAKEGLLDNDAVQAKIDEAVAAAKDGLLDADTVEAKITEAISAAKEGLLDPDAVQAKIDEAAAPLNEKIAQLEETVKGMFSQEDIDKAVAAAKEGLLDADAVQAKVDEAVAAAKKEFEAAAAAAAEAVAPAANEAVPAANEAAPAEEAAPAAAVMDHAAYVAAELDTPVCVETYVQAHQGWWDGKVTVYAQSEDGAYFIYNMACATAEDADKLVPGTCIRVNGYKAEWSGEVEIIDATYEIIDGNGFIAAAADLTDKLGAEDLIDHENEFFAVKDAKVVAYNEAGNAFSYAWDGSGSHDANSDLYFNVEVNGAVYTFTVESYLCGNDTPVYAAVEALQVGNVIDAEGFLYWYNGVNPHITAVTVK